MMSRRNHSRQFGKIRLSSETMTTGALTAKAAITNGGPRSLLICTSLLFSTRLKIKRVFKILMLVHLLQSLMLNSQRQALIL